MYLDVINSFLLAVCSVLMFFASRRVWKTIDRFEDAYIHLLSLVRLYEQRLKMRPADDEEV